jgi:hypothetical protein
MYLSYTVSPYPNSALPAWEMAIVAVIPVLALVIWLVTIFLAARDGGGSKQAVAGAPPKSAAAPSGSRPPSVVSGREPERPPADRAVA